MILLSEFLKEKRKNKNFVILNDVLLSEVPLYSFLQFLQGIKGFDFTLGQRVQAFENALCKSVPGLPILLNGGFH